MLQKFRPADAVRNKRVHRHVVYLTPEEHTIISWAIAAANVSRGELIGELLRRFVDFDPAILRKQKGKGADVQQST